MITYKYQQGFSMKLITLSLLMAVSINIHAIIRLAASEIVIKDNKYTKPLIFFGGGYAAIGSTVELSHVSITSNYIDFAAIKNTRSLNN